MGYVTGEAKELPLRPVVDRRIKLEFHGARITSDGGLLAYMTDREPLQRSDHAAASLRSQSVGGLWRRPRLFRACLMQRLDG